MKLSRLPAGAATNDAKKPRTDLLCFSHLRWDFVFQRPQHLLSRAARTMRVLFWEEPMHTTAQHPSVDRRLSAEGVIVLRPRIPHGQHWATVQRTLLDAVLQEFAVQDPVLWYYTPHALSFSSHLEGRPVVFDCMDELSAFAGADPELPRQERDLMARAALVFTGGQSLYESKRTQHPDVHAFPSGVDTDHFHACTGRLARPGGPAGDPPSPHGLLWCAG